MYFGKTSFVWWRDFYPIMWFLEEINFKVTLAVTKSL